MTTRPYKHDGTFWRFTFMIGTADRQFKYRTCAIEGPEGKARNYARKMLRSLFPASPLRLKGAARFKRFEKDFKRKGSRPWR